MGKTYDYFFQICRLLFLYVSHVLESWNLADSFQQWFVLLCYMFTIIYRSLPKLWTKKYLFFTLELIILRGSALARELTFGTQLALVFYCFKFSLPHIFILLKLWCFFSNLYVIFQLFRPLFNLIFFKFYYVLFLLVIKIWFYHWMA